MRLTTPNVTEIAHKLFGTDLWESAQNLAAPTPDGLHASTEREALEVVSKYIDEWTEDARDNAYGGELVLAIDLALRHGAADRIPGWLDRRRARFERSFVLHGLLCLPAASKAIAGGLLSDVLRLSDAQREDAVKAVEVAIASAKSAPKAVPKVQKRTVGGEYNQFYVEPETLNPGEAIQVYFQDPRDTDRGLSLFDTKVGVGTPADTLEVKVEVTVETKPPKQLDVEGATRAVAFPLSVRGPLQLRSVDGEDREDAIEVPLGRHDVLACFYPRRKHVYRVTLQFYPAGSLSAPKTLRIETA